MKRVTDRHSICSMHRNRYKRYKSFELPNHPPRRSPSSAARMTINNPMFNPIYKQKCIDKLKEIGHKPCIQGGNGRPASKAQQILFDSLGKYWVLELAVKTKLNRTDAYPYHYKIDIANELLKIAIEVDGTSHYALKQKEKDLKKTQVLESLGWKVLRYKNNQIINDLETVLDEINENS